MPFSFWLFLFVFLDLDFINFTFFHFPRKIICCPCGQGLQYLSCLEMSNDWLIVSHENQSETIFFVGSFERKYSFWAGELIFVMVISQNDFIIRNLLLFLYWFSRDLLHRLFYFFFLFFGFWLWLFYFFWLRFHFLLHFLFNESWRFLWARSLHRHFLYRSFRECFGLWSHFLGRENSFFSGSWRGQLHSCYL